MLYDQFVLLLTGSHKFSELSPHQVDSLVRFNFDASVYLNQLLAFACYNVQLHVYTLRLVIDEI